MFMILLFITFMTGGGLTDLRVPISPVVRLTINLSCFLHRIVVLESNCME